MPHRLRELMVTQRWAQSRLRSCGPAVTASRPVYFERFTSASRQFHM